MDEETKKTNKRRALKVLAIILLVIVIIWFSLALIEYYRVKNDKKPLICFGNLQDVEDVDEYSTLCYGPLYKYKEYYYKDSNKISAREFTLFFMEFKRESTK